MSYVGTKSSVIPLMCLQIFHSFTKWCLYFNMEIIPGYIVVVDDVEVAGVVDIVDVVVGVDVVDVVDS